MNKQTHKKTNNDKKTPNQTKTITKNQTEGGWKRKRK